MVAKRNKLYDSETYGAAYKVFLKSNATSLTSDLELPLMMVIKCTKLYDPGASGTEIGGRPVAHGDHNFSWAPMLS
jgi:hypothetical protein